MRSNFEIISTRIFTDYESAISWAEANGYQNFDLRKADNFYVIFLFTQAAI